MQFHTRECKYVDNLVNEVEATFGHKNLLAHDAPVFNPQLVGLATMEHKRYLVVCTKNGEDASPPPELSEVFEIAPIATKDEIKKLRKQANLTQQQSANLLGITLNGFQKYEDGSRKMNVGSWQLFRQKCKQRIEAGMINEHPIALVFDDGSMQVVGLNSIPKVFNLGPLSNHQVAAINGDDTLLPLRQIAPTLKPNQQEIFLQRMVDGKVKSVLAAEVLKSKLESQGAQEAKRAKVQKRRMARSENIQPVPEENQEN